VRLGGSAYTVAKTGAEVQQVVVALPRREWQAWQDGTLVLPPDTSYSLRFFSLNGMFNTTTAPLALNASAAEMQRALEELPNIGAGNVVVTRRGSGVVGDAFIFRVYFEGASVRADIPLMVPAYSFLQPYVTLVTSTVVQGGRTEHQRLDLSVESGEVRGAFFKLRLQQATSYDFIFTSSSFGNWSQATTGCLEWGLPAAELEAHLQALSPLSELNLTQSRAITVDTRGRDLVANATVALSGGITDGAIFVGDVLRIAGATGGAFSPSDEFTVEAVGGGAPGQGVVLTLSPKLYTRAGQGSELAHVSKVRKSCWPVRESSLSHPFFLGKLVHGTFAGCGKSAPFFCRQVIKGAVRVARSGFGRGVTEVQRIHITANQSVAPTVEGQVSVSP
jgi:hypothetical protein